MADTTERAGIAALPPELRASAAGGAGRSAPRTSGRLPGLRALATIRGKIFGAFLLMTLIIAGLGWFSYMSIRQTGTLVVETYDRSLQTISYARSAAADFASMQATLVRRALATDSTQRQVLQSRAEELSDSLREDLEIAATRARSSNAARAARAASDALVRCEAVHASDSIQADWRQLDDCVQEVDKQIELLVEVSAGDGFLYRQRALAAITTDLQLDILAVLAAVTLSALLTWLLARRIVGPVAAASSAASRIAGGELETAIPRGSHDELGELLAAMAVMRDNIRAMMEAEVSRRRSAQALLVDAVESTREGVVLVDRRGDIALVNSQAAEFFPARRALLRAGTPFARLILPEEVRHEPQQAVLTAGYTTERQLTDGRWLRVSRSPTREGGFVEFYSDITELRQRAAELERINLQFDAALGNMSQGLCQFDADEHLQVFNPRYCEIYRLDKAAVSPGMTLLDLIELSVQAGNHDREAAELHAEWHGFVSRGQTGATFQELRDGRVVAIAFEPMPGGGCVATFEDITDRRRAEAQIMFMARHDSLTSLPNRVLFGERVRQALLGLDASDGSGRFSVMHLDLDHFKAVNDAFGHPVGDRLLQEVAGRLLSCVGEHDTVARLGGDEFALVQVGLSRIEDAGMLARRIVAAIGEPFILDGVQVMVGVSIGIAVAPTDGPNPDTLLKNADMALYRAKGDGRNTSCFFEPDMDAQLQARRRLELDLRHALAEEQFQLFYQPLLDLRTDRVCGFEALLRWSHPVRGMVSPAEFVPIAEEIGLIVPMGEWVLRQACREATAWPDHIKVAVNVSPAQFRNMRLVELTKSVLAETGLSARRLELEITESVLLQDNESVLSTLHQLRGLGVRISMDDFGTGYSSLSYLRSFPFDKIKIDQSFIRDLTENADSLTIVRAIIGLGVSLGMKVTAEGVETPEQVARLRSARCDQVQGYLFSRPRPARDVPGLLSRLDAT